MLMFWIAASLMIAVALVMVLPPLIGGARSGATDRRAINVAIFQERLAALEHEHAAGGMGTEEYRRERTAVERQMLSDLDAGAAAGPGASRPRSPGGSVAGIVMAVLLPLLALGLYFQFGDPLMLVQPPPRGAGAPATAQGALSAEAAKAIPHSVEEMVASLETRLRSKPADPDGWLMLGRSYAAMNRLLEARDALAEANRQRPRHPFTMIAFAEVQAGLQGNRLDGEPLRLVHEALAIDPNFARGLWLAGVAAYKNGDGEGALDHWHRLARLKDLDARSLAQVQQAIAQVSGQAGPGAAAAASPGSAAGAAQLSVRVELAPELAAKAAPEDVVFVFARAVEGPRMPLAIQRLRVAELPRTLILDDSMAMAPQMRLSLFSQVVVGARVSRSGSATPSPGDLTGTSAPVAVGAGDTVAVRIDQVSG